MAFTVSEYRCAHAHLVGIEVCDDAGLAQVQNLGNHAQNMGVCTSVCSLQFLKKDEEQEGYTLPWISDLPVKMAHSALLVLMLSAWNIVRAPRWRGCTIFRACRLTP